MRCFSETGDLEDIRGTSESVLKELIRFGIVRLREDDPAVSVRDRRVVFRSGAEEEFDRIICATGYSPAWLPVEGGEVTHVKAFGERSSRIVPMSFCEPRSWKRILSS